MLLMKIMLSVIITSIISQKDQSQNGGNKKTKHAKFSEKRTFLIPCNLSESGCIKYSFFENFDLLCFLVISVLRFAFLPY